MKMKSTKLNCYKVLSKEEMLQMNLLGQESLDYLTFHQEI